ncbi:hypothetical protein KYB31_15220 [Clostridium felsineum]|uniref:hypothetical protein n=1 Tax=Clostridium felsineum TaxID=36839 RepID=UPI00214D3E5A|nr:hypothetical protein [Clostridium felsineum]MCR3760329.1 hypothetical protein [Clostridium felsineum]
MCLMCFLRDNYQYNLRKSARYRSDRFEQTLMIYKKTFITKFIEEKDKDICSEYNNDINNNIKMCIKQIGIKEIDEFFNNIIDIYFNWINSCTSKSINEFKEILEKYKILSLKKSILNLTLFRGRKSENLISKWDMFHIPFNKRYKIANERYSLIGQPLLYLAKSPYCVFSELGDMENIWISSFYFKDSVKKEEVFDNTNHFERYIMNNQSLKSSEDIDSMVDTKKHQLTYNEIKRLFFQFILSSCCSFSKYAEEYNFCEEYVLPQILAQILKEKKIKGVMYKSTKIYKNINPEIKINDDLIDLLSCNICLFTNYDHKKIDDGTYVYDHKLYNKFEISTPILIKSESDNDVLGLDNSIDIIINIMQEFFEKRAYLDIISGSNKSIMRELILTVLLYKKHDGDIDKCYNQSMKLHFFMIKNIILDIVDNINYRRLANNE